MGTEEQMGEMFKLSIVSKVVILKDTMAVINLPNISEY